MTAQIGRRQALGGLLALAACTPVPGRGAGGRSGAVTAEPLAELKRTFEAVWTMDGAGAKVRRIFPTPKLRHLDPFVLLDDFQVVKPAGFPMHPHRGFEAFTYMMEGRFHHRDTMGNDSVIGPGGTQRFTSGRGARHSEMPASEGRNRGLQLWVNLPRRLKKMDPSYAGLPGEAFHVREERDGTAREIVGASSPVDLQTEVSYEDLMLLADGGFDRSIPRGHNALLYVIAGEMEVAGVTLREGQVALPGPGRLQLRGRRGARAALLSGRPHDEPIRQHGPYVD